MTFSMLRGLRHLPFFEALGALDPSTRDWASISAGLVTLRLFDLRRAQESGGSAIVAAEVGAVRDAIATMPEGDLSRSILANVVDAATEGPVASTERALPSLLAYGKSLQLAAQWGLAVDVFETLLEHPGSGEQEDIALQAAMKCAYCLRIASRFDEAEAAYDRVRRLAVTFEDRSAGFLSEIGRANVALQRGNYPKAEAMLDGVIASSAEAGCDGAQARALHDRGVVAYRRGLREEALRFWHQALVRQSEPSQRDRLLADIATALGDLGHVAAARDVHMLIEVVAVEQDARWRAMINLMALSASDGSELSFERYRRRLADAVLPPHLEAGFQLHAAEGFRRLGRREAARTALEQAATIARTYGLNDLTFRAESALEEIDRELVSSQPEFSPIVTDVLRTVNELRALADATT